MTTEKVTRNEVKVQAQVPPNFNDVVTLCVKEGKFTVSAQGKGNPQVVLLTEIIEPLEYKAVDGKVYALDSQELTFYLPTKKFKDGVLDEADTRKAQDRLLTFHERVDLPVEIVPDNPNVTQYEKICFRIHLTSQEDIPQRRNPATGKYEALTDGKGQPIKKGWKWVNMIDNVLDRVVKESNRPY